MRPSPLASLILLAASVAACSTTNDHGSSTRAQGGGGNSVGSGPTIQCLPLNVLVCAEGKVPVACPNDGFTCIGGGAGTVPTLPPLPAAEAETLFKAMPVAADNVPVGGGLVMRKTQDVECTQATIAAPGGMPTTSYSCLSLTDDESHAVWDRLTGDETGAGGGGGVVRKKAGLVECTSAQASGPQGPGGQSQNPTTFSCRFIATP